MESQSKNSTYKMFYVMLAITVSAVAAFVVLIASSPRPSGVQGLVISVLGIALLPLVVATVASRTTKLKKLLNLRRV